MTEIDINDTLAEIIAKVEKDREAKLVDDKQRSGLTYNQAMTALIDERYEETKSWNSFPYTRDQVATECENICIAAELFGEHGIGESFYQEIKDGLVTFGFFNNCRGYGLTVEIAGWTFCAYEHRNSGNICIEGCPTAEIKPYGPYGGVDKYDTLASFGYREYGKAREALIVMMETVRDSDFALTREFLKKTAKFAA